MISKEDYKKYIKSPAWKRLRIQALIRDNFICCKCKNTKATDVHHIIYPDDFKNDCVENLISVCKDCHEILEDVDYYTKDGVVRIKKIKCEFCGDIKVEKELDMLEGKWICNECESLKKGDFEDGN